MNCAELADATGWMCSPVGEHSIRAIAPFELDEGGQHAAFYIASPTDSTFYLTDASEAAMYAEHMGVALNARRYKTLNKTSGVTMAQFDQSGSIVASGSAEDLNTALWDAVKLAMSLSFKKAEWQPKFAQEKFKSIVFKELSAQLGAERIIRSARIQAASGNIIEFPIGVKRKDGLISYVQPIAMENEKFNWGVVYQAHGKFFDVKATSEINNRIAIIEDGAPEAEFGRVAHFLGDAAIIRTLKNIREHESAFE